MKTILSSMLSIGLIIGAVWIALHRQQIIDTVTVWQYQPTEEIAQLVDRAVMTDHGRFLFYATEPRLEGTQAFNNVCTRQEKGSAILGCYVDGKIFVYDIDDTRLDGVKEVTAAHEMLHAAYERLPSSQQSQLASELDAAYEQVKDEALVQRMAYYDRTEPGQRANELHSILATEYENLPQSLEGYFQQYFTDRKAVVKLHGQYSAKFAELADSTAKLKERLESLSAQITNETSQYEASLGDLNSRINQFNTRANAGGFSSRAQFDTERTELVQASEQLNHQRASISAKVNEYEQSRLQYNSLVDESNSMQQALDSSLAPAPSL